MATYLTIVETAYRATIEEQDDTAVWFAHAMKNGGADVSVLLRGNAVNYAMKGQDARGLVFGEQRVKGPDIARDVAALAAKAKVFVVTEDCADRGIAREELVGGVGHVARADLAKFIDGFDRFLHF
jgi:hypothetical protein